MTRGSAPGPGSPEWEARRAQAVELRRAGRTRREIGEALGIRDGNKISDLLRGEPRVLGGKWPDRVKQERARTLRRFGYTQYEICRVIEASRSSVSRWVRDVEWNSGIPDGNGQDAVEWEELRERARALRAEGWSLPSIAEHLALSNREDVERLCRGVRVGMGRGHRKPVAGTGS
jgi:predicted transcriptional regulator